MKKNQNASAKSIASPAIIKINLDQFKDQLGKIEIKEKKERESLYNYPEGFSKEMISSEKGKKFRSSLRNQLKRICNNILLYAKMNRMEDLNAEIDLFASFYKKNYRLNDYSLKSLSYSQNEEKSSNFDLMMQIIKEIKK